jgi:hypothetical protein
VGRQGELSALRDAHSLKLSLNPSPEQAACLRRQFGDRRYAHNWAVRTLKADLDRYHAIGEETEKTCHACGSAQEIGRAEHWTCTGCGARHQRDDNAAINLARYEDTSPSGDSAVGPVGAAVKRRADRKTGPRPAGGREARKGRSRTAAEQPRDGVPV